MTKLISLLSSMARFLTVALCSAMVLVALLMLVATAYSADYTIYIAFGYLFSLLTIWCAFEQLSKSAGVFARYEPFALMLFCFFVYFAFIRVLPSLGQNGMAQYSDAYVALKAQQLGTIGHLHKTFIEYWCNYEVLLSMAGVLFGGNICVGQILNALCCVFTLLPMYMMAMEVSGRGMARFSTLALGLSPTVIMYSMTYTGEFLASMFMFYAGYFLIRAWSSRTMTRESIDFAAFSGALLGVSHLFKPITIIFLVAMVFYLGVSVLSLPKARRVLRAVLVSTLVFVTSLCVKSIGQSVFTSMASVRNVSTETFGSHTVFELVLGLNLLTDGCYSRDLAHRLLRMDVAEQRDFLWQAIKRDWKRYPALMVRKFVRLHGSPSSKGHCIDVFRISFNSTEGSRMKPTNSMPSWVIPLTHSETLVNRILFLLGVGGLAFAVIKKPIAIRGGVFFAAVVLEFVLIEQLIECHGRYKTALYPYFFMSIPYVRGLSAPWNYVRNKFIGKYLRKDA